MPPTGTDAHVGQMLGQKYRLASPIGSGASARVYVAEDVTLGRRVAVKLLHAGLTSDPKFLKRFRAEARSAARLSHPNLLAVFDWSDQNENSSAPAYLVTELLTGGSLRSVLDAGQPLTLSQALVVGLHAAEGLSYAHANGVVHRDVKPANLLFGDDGRLRIADFGIARAVAETAWTEPEGALVGTVRYAAPEQASGGEIDGRADVYALALTVVEAATGVVPLVASTPLATMVLRQDTDLVVGDELGPLRPAIEAAGSADPEARSDAAEFAAALHAAAKELPRPTALALTGLPPTEAQDETTILVLDEEGLADTAIDTTSTEPAAADAVVFDDQFDDDQDTYVDLEDKLRRWPIVLLLLVLGAAAVFAYQSRDMAAREPEVVTQPVGSYIGRSIDDVLVDVELNGWESQVTTARADGSEAGEVLEQSPAAGTALEEGFGITLVVSQGQLLRESPTLVGLQLEVALSALEERGLLLGSTEERFDEDVVSGEVISASVAAGVEIEVGTTIDLAWSKGPEPRVVPEIVGTTLEEAAAALTEIGLALGPIGEDFSQDIAEGLIIAIEPGVGVSVARGTEIAVVVSLGLPFVDVPNVVGLSAAEAADLLAEAGFTVVDTIGPPNSEVLVTDPPAGESLRQGSEIVIVTRR